MRKFVKIDYAWHSSNAGGSLEEILIFERLITDFSTHITQLVSNIKGIHIKSFQDRCLEHYNQSF